jgi:D-amino-acid oxidase
MTDEIVILGGGVVGVTTGIVLQLLDYRTRLVCRHWLGDVDDSSAPDAAEPRFASQFPAASIFPHSVDIADEPWHVQTALRVFEALHYTGAAGVRKQRHYDIFDAPATPASYAEAMPGYHPLPADGSGEPGAPRRADDRPIYGWSSQIHFAEMPRYRRFLTRLYQHAGGHVKSGNYFDAHALEGMEAAAVINCGGAWGRHLFGDPRLSCFLKGILVRAHTSQWPVNRLTGEVFSYNFYPETAAYARPHGGSADVYFYPRTDGWLLGGTRFESAPLQAGADPAGDYAWRGEEWEGPTVRVPREGIAGAEIDVPKPIIDLNREILLRLTGVDIDELPLSAMAGYRHRRYPVRLEMEERQGRPVIHNYGHGGGGVTLSWSSGLKAAMLLAQALGQPPESGGDPVEDLVVRLIERCATLI